MHTLKFLKVKATGTRVVSAASETPNVVSWKQTLAKLLCLFLIRVCMSVFEPTIERGASATDMLYNSCRQL